MADPFQAFQMGTQLGAGQSSLGAMVKQIVSRFGQQQEAQLKFGGELALEEAKGRLGQQRSQELMRSLFGQGGTGQGGIPGVGGGQFPPGSKINANLSTGEVSLGLEANPTIAMEKSQIAGLTPEVRPTVERMKRALPLLKTGGRLLAQTAQATPTPFLVGKGISTLSGDAPETQRAIQEVIQARQQLLLLAFSFGGRQLTTQERRIITDLLDTVGKDDDLIAADLDRFTRIFERMRAAGLSGQVGLDEFEQAQMLRQVMSEEGAITGRSNTGLPQGFQSR